MRRGNGHAGAGQGRRGHPAHVAVVQPTYPTRGTTLAEGLQYKVRGCPAAISSMSPDWSPDCVPDSKGKAEEGGANAPRRPTVGTPRKGY
jgi:hypothetical protein